ncbi:MAG: hypothetical protein IPG47_17910 [Thermoflexaceae bacterium]|nr:hypothetical protein [Thermoflexaceae bacterium]
MAATANAPTSPGPYEFGDPFQPGQRRGTIMNALEREGCGAPVHLDPEDF